MDTREGMANVDANSIIATIRDNVPSMPEQEKCAILMNLMGVVGATRGYTKPSEKSKSKRITGVSLYCKVGGRVNITGNLIVRRTGAVGEEALAPILNAPSLKNLELKEVEVSLADSSSADDVQKDLQEIGV